jgi:hypothetical protein
VSESKCITKYVLICLRLAAECRGVAAAVPERDLKAHYLRLASKWTELADQSLSRVLH